MIVKAAAKINLLLDILDRTDDGYHTVFMVMQSVGIQDTLTVDLGGKKGTITVTCSAEKIPSGADNICWKAADAFFSALRMPNPGVSVHIEKHIPSAAGLAGGSADAAGVLVALNALTGAGLSERELCRIGLTVGADVPFCIMGGTMLAQDIGGVLAPLPDVPNDWYVLVKPDQDVSTGNAYAAFDSTNNIRHMACNDMLHAIVKEDFEKMYACVGNVFEQLVEVPGRVEIKAIMRGYGSAAYCMSGSGPTIFGIFQDGEDAASCADALTKKGYKNVFLCRPLKRGIEIVEE